MLYLHQVHTMTKEGFVRYMCRLHPALVKTADSHPDKNGFISFKKDILLELINDKALNSYADAMWDDMEYIRMKDFVNYMTNNANTKNTKGMYHKYIDFIINYYDVPVVKGMPMFDLVTDNELKKKITPLRLEYTIVWYILNRLRNHSFIKRYIMTYAKATFQEPVGYNDNRFYDILFELLYIIIEAHEDSGNHDRNYNDMVKESLARDRTFNILYFKMQKYNEDQVRYLDEFCTHLENSIVSALLNINRDIREDYIMHCFVEGLTNKKQKIMSAIIDMCNGNPDAGNTKLVKGWLSEVKNINRILGNVDSRMVKKIFGFKSSASIHVDDIVQLVSDISNYNNASDISNIKEEVTGSGILVLKGECLYATWGDMVRIIISLDVDEMVKDTLLVYVTNVSDIYEDVIVKIQTHLNERLETTKNMTKMTFLHMDQQFKKQYEPVIRKLEKEKSVFEEQLANISKKMIRTVQLADNLDKSIRSKIANKKERDWMGEMDAIRQELRDMNEKNKINNLTLSRVSGQSIFEELPNFPIIYSRSGQVYGSVFEAICNEWDIPVRVRTKVYKSFCLPHTTGKMNIIPFIAIRKDKHHIYNMFQSYMEDDEDFDELDSDASEKKRAAIMASLETQVKAIEKEVMKSRNKEALATCSDETQTSDQSDTEEVTFE
jgi:hypothetical protein